MQRLIDRNLRYGELFEVKSKALRTRYNRALEALTGRKTRRQKFHIDITGFSPEIAEEFKDPLYLNPNGVNRKYILLTTKQATLPIVGASFSWTATMLRKFIETNRETLFTLTSRDVVFGELDNSTYRLDGLEDLLSIRQVKVVVRTSNDLMKAAKDLRGRIDRFVTSDSDWQDEEALKTLVDLAKKTGDIHRYPLRFKKLTYPTGNFFTRHFGGLYVFGDRDDPTILSIDPAFDKMATDSAVRLSHVPMRAPDKVLAFFKRTGAIEYVHFDAPKVALPRLREMANFFVVDMLAKQEPKRDLTGLGETDFKRAIYEHLDALPDEFHTIMRIVKLLEQDPRSVPTRLPTAVLFYLLRARAQGDAALINHLLAHYTPADFRASYLWNRELFLAQYETWPGSKKDYVVAYLERNPLDEALLLTEAVDLSIDATGRPHPLPEAPPAGPWGVRQ